MQVAEEEIASLKETLTEHEKAVERDRHTMVSFEGSSDVVAELDKLFASEDVRAHLSSEGGGKMAAFIKDQLRHIPDPGGKKSRRPYHPAMIQAALRLLHSTGSSGYKKLGESLGLALPHLRTLLR